MSALPRWLALPVLLGACLSLSACGDSASAVDDSSGSGDAPVVVVVTGPQPVAPPDVLPERVEVFQPGSTIALLDVVEDMSEEVANRFLGLAEAFRKRDLVVARGWLADGFVGQSAHGVPVAELNALPLDVRETRFDVDAAPVVDGEGWLADWAEALGPFGAIEHALFKVKAAEFEPGNPPRGRVRFKVSVQGSDSTGGLIALVNWGVAEVVQMRGQWSLKAWRHESLTTSARAAPIFTDVSVPAGVAHKTGLFGKDGPAVFYWNGAASGDIDADGLWDLFVPSSTRSFLYRNRGDGTFDEVSADWGLADDAGGTGALLLDLDDDGDDDLLVAHVGWTRADGTPGGDSLRAYRNTGDGFADVSAELGFDGRHVAFSLTAADLTGDGKLDVYVSCYNRMDAVYPSSWYQAENGTPNALYVQQDDGTFRDEAADRGAADDRWTFAAAAHDIDADGDLDLYLANDYGDNALLVNDGTGHFEDRAAEAGLLDTGNGMATAWGDLESDGDLDLYVANMSSTAGKRILQRLVPSDADGTEGKLVKLASGNSIFEFDRDTGFAKRPADDGGIGASWAWSSAWGDLDLDGDEDLMVANGFLSGESAADT